MSKICILTIFLVLPGFLLAQYKHKFTFSTGLAVQSGEKGHGMDFSYQFRLHKHFTGGVNIGLAATSTRNNKSGILFGSFISGLNSSLDAMVYYAPPIYKKLSAAAGVGAGLRKTYSSYVSAIPGRSAIGNAHYGLGFGLKGEIGIQYNFSPVYAAGAKYLIDPTKHGYSLFALSFSFSL